MQQIQSTKDPVPSTSSEGGRKAHTRLSAGNEDDHSPGQLGMDHHSDGEVGEGGPHKDLRRDDVGAGNLQSEGEEGSGDHSHPDSRGLGGEGLETAHGNAPEGYSREGEGSGGRNHPWGQGTGDEVGNETDRGRGQDVPQSSGSGNW
jgi:hypothetical protein